METPQKKLMVVDDCVSNLTVARSFLSPYYETYLATSATQMFKMLEKVKPDLILLDIEMPEMDGYRALEKLKADKSSSCIPVIFLTGQTDTESEVRGFDTGAADYINKPFSPPLLLRRIEHQLLIAEQKATIQYHVDNLSFMVSEKVREVTELQNAILDIVADLVECRDQFTGGHISRTQLYLKVLIGGLVEERLYLDKMLDWNIDYVLQSALLHDVGKIAIPDAILNKPTKLSSEEFEIMQTHVIVGVEAVNRIISKTQDHALLHHALNIVGTHHEKWDGTGYPHGLKGVDIPLEGHLMALVDVYDALTSWRPYKEKLSHDEAIKIILAGKGTHFDPALVDVLMKKERAFEQISLRSEVGDGREPVAPVLIAPTEIGIPHLDKQHKVLFALFQDVIHAGANLDSEVEAREVLEYIENYAIGHLSDEEALLEQSNYPKCEWHRSVHREFRSRLRKTKADLDKRGVMPDFSQQLNSLIIGGMARHINSADVEFGRYYQMRNSVRSYSDLRYS